MGDEGIRDVIREREWLCCGVMWMIGIATVIAPATVQESGRECNSCDFAVSDKNDKIDDEKHK